MTAEDSALRASQRSFCLSGKQEWAEFRGEAGQQQVHWRRYREPLAEPHQTGPGSCTTVHTPNAPPAPRSRGQRVPNASFVFPSGVQTAEKAGGAGAGGGRGGTKTNRKWANSNSALRLFQRPAQHFPLLVTILTLSEPQLCPPVNLLPAQRSEVAAETREW